MPVAAHADQPPQAGASRRVSRRRKTTLLVITTSASRQGRRPLRGRGPITRVVAHSARMDLRGRRRRASIRQEIRCSVAYPLFFVNCVRRRGLGSRMRISVPPPFEEGFLKPSSSPIKSPDHHGSASDSEQRGGYREIVPTFDFLFLLLADHGPFAHRLGRRHARNPFGGCRSCGAACARMGASGQWWVFEMSAISSLVGSVFGPAPHRADNERQPRASSGGDHARFWARGYRWRPPRKS